MRRIFLFALILVLSSCGSKKEIVKTSMPEKGQAGQKEKKEPSGIETPAKMEMKTTAEINAEENIANKKLRIFIDEWYGTAYKYAGNDKSGIDCSHFASKIYAEIYHKTISGSSASIEKETETIKLSEAKEGDLLFFKIDGNRVSHIAVYLGDKRFVHASTRRGVLISSLEEPYYKKTFFKAGRLNKS